jgi:hypothetical protein
LYFLIAVSSFCIVSGTTYPKSLIENVPFTTLFELSDISTTVENESMDALNLKRSGSPQYESEA